MRTASRTIVLTPLGLQTSPSDHRDSAPELDTLLFDRLQTGDVSALSEIADRWGARVFRLAYRVTGDHATAEDVQQAVFLKLLENRCRLKKPQCFAAWMTRVTVNEAITTIRSRKRSPTTPGAGASAADLEGLPEHPDTADKLESRGVDRKGRPGALGITVGDWGPVVVLNMTFPLLGKASTTDNVVPDLWDESAAEIAGKKPKTALRYRFNQPVPDAIGAVEPNTKANTQIQIVEEGDVAFVVTDSPDPFESTPPEPLPNRTAIVEFKDSGGTTKKLQVLHSGPVTSGQFLTQVRDILATFGPRLRALNAHQELAVVVFGGKNVRFAQASPKSWTSRYVESSESMNSATRPPDHVLRVPATALLGVDGKKPSRDDILKAIRIE